MKKYLSSLAVTFAAISCIFVLGASLKAQAQVVCPVGYTCTPIAAQPVGCPAGYTCTPIDTASSASYSSVSQNTNQSACRALPPNLSIGSTGKDVSDLQTWLMDNGFDIPALSSGAAPAGYYGSQSAAALARYKMSEKYISCLDTEGHPAVSSTTIPVYASSTVGAAPSEISAHVPVVIAFNGQAMSAGSANDMVIGQYFTGVTSAYLGSTVYGNSTTYSLGYMVNSDSSITLTVPASVPSGLYNLYLVNSVGTSHVFPVRVGDTQASQDQSGNTPVVLGVFGGEPVAPGSSDTITGQYFAGVTSAYIYGLGSTYSLGYTVNNDSSITLTVPGSVPSGLYSLYLVGSMGTSHPFMVQVSSQHP